MSEQEPKPTLWQGRAEVSKRRRTRLRRFTYAVLAPLGSGLFRLLSMTWRVRYCSGSECLSSAQLDQLIVEHPNCVASFWHEHLAGCLQLLFGRRQSGLQPALLVSPSVDGDLIHKVLDRFGVHVVRGSATRSGGPAIRQLYRACAKHGAAPVVAVDGPQGPVREAKPGAVMLAQLCGTPILPLASAVSFKLRLKNWDRTHLPLPFARLMIAVGTPMEIPRDLPPEQLAGQVEALERQLTHLTTLAEEQL